MPRPPHVSFSPISVAIFHEAKLCRRRPAPPPSRTAAVLQCRSAAVPRSRAQRRMTLTALGAGVAILNAEKGGHRPGGGSKRWNTAKVDPI